MDCSGTWLRGCGSGWGVFGMVGSLSEVARLQKLTFSASAEVG